MTEYLNFTKTNLDQIKSANKRIEVADSKVPGLRLRVNTNSTKTYFLYRKVNGKPFRLNIGRYTDLTVEQARNEAKRWNSEITLGRDLALERKEKRAELTFKELHQLYYDHYALIQTKRPEDARKIIAHHFFPVHGNDKVSAITSQQIRKLHSTIGLTHKAIANKVTHLVSAVFNFGIRNGYFTGNNPCIGLQKFRLVSRDRFLSQDELKLFRDALGQEKPLFQDFFLLALYTGARKSNLLSMRWADIDLQLRRWRIPDSQTKNRDVNIVLLSEKAISILERRYLLNKNADLPSEFVFPGESAEKHLKDPKKAFQRIRERMGVHDIRIHDLRRTLGSHMAINGASLPIIGSALNHKSQESTKIYARLSQNPVLEAINQATSAMPV